MPEHRRFEPDCSLEDLAAALGDFEAIDGALVAIGHQAGDTIGSFDDGVEGTGRIVLRPGKPLPNPPGAVIDTDAVYILGQLQTVTAYRPS